MQNKFEIYQNYYTIDWSKIIYPENRIREKVQQNLDHCPRIKSNIFFTSIRDFFNYLKNICNNLIKKNLMEKFKEMKIEANLFSNFYLKFVSLTSDFEYTAKTFIKKIEYKLTLHLQNLDWIMELNLSFQSEY